MADWIAESLTFLNSSQRSDGGWSYFASGDSAIEPTATAVAALGMHGGDTNKIDAGIQFIVSLQDPDGSIRPQPTTPDPTSLAAYATIPMTMFGSDVSPGKQTADYLVSYDPIAPAREPKSPIKDNSSLKGFA